jgi:integrase
MIDEIDGQASSSSDAIEPVSRRRIARALGLHVWSHALRHAVSPGCRARARAGLGLDKIRARSRHRTIATLMLYVGDNDREQTQKALADLAKSR